MRDTTADGTFLTILGKTNKKCSYTVWLNVFFLQHFTGISAGGDMVYARLEGSLCVVLQL